MTKRKIAILTAGWSVDYILAIIEGMKKACKDKNTDLYFFTCYPFTEPSGVSNTTGFAIFDLMNFGDFDGVVIMPNLFNNDEEVQKWHKKILELKIPAVSINQPLEGLHFVNSENHEAFKESVLHLINHHHVKTFAYIDGPEDNAGSISNFQAYKEALEESGIDFSKQIYAERSDWTFQSAHKIAKKIFEDKDNIPEAIVCINDWAAMASIKLAEENGLRVPEDIKIIGFDDVYISTKVIPSISSVSINAEKMGECAINLLFENPATPTTKVIEAVPKYRQSCGCEKEITREQIIYTQNFSSLLDKEQRFSSQLRHLEDSFIKYETVEILSENLQKYFASRHAFEGPDFSILINESVINSLKETLISPKESTNFDNKLVELINLQSGISTNRRTIETKELFPENMKSDESTLYLFLPIFNQQYLHGYYVSKNFTDLLINKCAYNWTRNFGTIIEKFRQTSIYRMLSEQMKFLSTQDALSGLFNRAGLKRYGQPLFEKNNAENNQTEIIFVDINQMKVINDKFGHLQGDLAVKTVAEAILFSIPSGYIAIRYGGDEFVIIGTHTQPIDITTKIQKNLQVCSKKMTLPYKLSASLGSKVFQPNEIQSLNEAIKEVDEIMYKNKVIFHAMN